jgi:crossover junction endodeoxyribonuclease RuvC
MTKRRILGIDPSLVACGWGVISVAGTKVSHVAHGVIKPNRKAELPLRLQELHAEMTAVIADFAPDAVAVEEAFMKDNAQSALKLGQARAACIIAATVKGLPVGEYSPRSVKQSVVGTGGADKAQVAHMVNVMMPGLSLKAGDAADALAIAICHSHRLGSGLAQALKG